jgi:TPR repeat protein
MSVLTFVLDGEFYPVRKKELISSCNFFDLYPDAFDETSYEVQSRVLGRDFQEFLLYLQSEERPPITSVNALAFLLLGQEFGLPDLSRECAQLIREAEANDSSVIVRLNALEENLCYHARLFQSFQHNFPALFYSRIHRLIDSLIEGEKLYRRGQELLYGEHGFERDVSRGLSLLKRSADLGHLESASIYSRHLAEGRLCAADAIGAAEYLRQSAVGGNCSDQWRYGLLLRDGSGVGRNFEEAAKYLKMSADQGYARGQTGYGLCLKNGEGVDKDIVEAARYFKMSADQGDSSGQCNYGLCLKNGEGVPQNVVDGAHYLKLSSDQCNSDGECYYGLCLKHGEGVSEDCGLAVDYFQRSAAQSNAEGELHYGLSLKQGEGIDLNLVEAPSTGKGVRFRKVAQAKGYFQAAADMGRPDALPYLEACQSFSIQSSPS